MPSHRYQSIAFLFIPFDGTQEDDQAHTRSIAKDVIDKAGINVESPKLLSEFYITCIASDNYKVVFSWNEIYNSPVGEHIVIITGADGKIGDQMHDRMAMLSAADKATGRRYVKSLQKIVISQVK